MGIDTVGGGSSTLLVGRGGRLPEAERARTSRLTQEVAWSDASKAEKRGR